MTGVSFFMRGLKRRYIMFFALAVLAACGGGGGGGGLPPGGGGHGGGGGGGGGGGTPTPSPPASITQQVAVVPTNAVTVTFGQIASGLSGTVSLPGTTGATATATVTLQAGIPSNDPVPSARRIFARPTILGASVSVIGCVTVSLNNAVVVAGTPSFNLSFKSGTLSNDDYIAYFDPTVTPNPSWSAMLGPVVASTSSAITFDTQVLWTPMTWQANSLYAFCVVQAKSPLPTPTPYNGPGLPPATAPPGDGYSPYQAASQLQFPTQASPPYFAANVNVAILMAGYPSQTDLSNFRADFLVPNAGGTVSYMNSVDGAPSPAPSGDPASVTDATLDTETIETLAPGANIVIHGLRTLSTKDFIDEVNRIVSNNATTPVNVILYTGSGCEFPTETSAVSVFQAAAAEGITIVSPAGSSGNECWDGQKFTLGSSWPATDGNVISVGGTETSQTSGYTLTSNTVWNDTGTSGGGAGGGGVSQYNTPAPNTQTAALLTNCLSPPAGATACSNSKKNVPDVSMPAENNAFLFSGIFLHPSPVGTSWSASQFAALMAELYQYCGGSLGSAAPISVPYYVYHADPNAFIDVVNGNDSYAKTTPYYQAGSGYDAASGLGVPLGMPFLQTACPGHAPASGLIARRASFQSVEQRPAQAYQTDVAPRVAGLSDLGRRSPAEQTRVQIVLPYTPSAAFGESAVIDALRNAGFTIVQTFGNHLVIDASAPSSTVERFFNTEMHDVWQGQNGTHYLPVQPVTIPASIAPYVAGVTLDDVVNMRAP
jgi:hypothetical protein